jgi:hypothetical protein
MDFSQPRISRVMMIAVPVPPNTAQGTRIQLPQNGTIQTPTTLVQMVETVDSNTLANGPNGTNIYNTPNYTLSLFSDGNIQKTDNLPFGLINPAINGGNPRYFNPFPINLQQSFVTVTANTSETNTTYLYLVFYILDMYTGN